MDLNYHSIESLLKAAKENSCRLSALVLEQQAEQMELPKQEIYKKMRENYRVMASCIQPGSAPDLKSTSGLTGGDAYRMRTAVEQGKNLTGPLLGGALYRALAVSELNASMGRIEDGRIECLYEKNRSSAYSRKLRHCTGSCTHHAGAVPAYRRGMRHVPFHSICSGNGNCQ